MSDTTASNAKETAIKKTRSTARSAKNRAAAAVDSAKETVSDVAETAKAQTIEAAEQVKAHVEYGGLYAKETAQAGQEQLVTMGQSVQSQVRQNPLTSLGIAFGVGVALTLLLKSKD